ncbi:MAG: 50S ribosomal protein L10, partial [Minisyncoccales bacterium]
QKKQEIIKDLTEKVKKQKSMVFFDFTGLSVKDLSTLRKKMKAAEAAIKVVKKTLLELVLKKAGINLDVKNLQGEIAVVFGYKDELAPIKICYQFSQENPNLKILTGFFEGEIKNKEEIIFLAQLPTRDELLNKLVGSLAAPFNRLVNTLQGNIKGLLHILAKAKI